MDASAAPATAAFAAYAAGRLEEAAALFEAALARDPEHFDSLHVSGVIAARTGRLDLAIERLGRAVARNPQSAEAYNSLAIALRRSGRLAEAVEAYRRALALRPDFVPALGNLGNALKDLGRFDEAIACYRRALALKPGDCETLNNLGAAHHAYSQLDEAETCYRQAVALAPDHVGSHFNLGVLAHDRGALEDAVSWWTRTLALQPEHEGAVLALGSLLQDLGRAEEARRVFRGGRARPDWEASAELTVSAIAESPAEIAGERDRLAAAIAAPGEGAEPVGDPTRSFCRRFFYLAYHGEDDRPLLEAAGRMFRRRAEVLNFRSERPRRLAADGRRRIGFLSQYLGEHTIGKLTQGLMRRLDRRRFHIVAIHAPGSKVDAVRRAIDAAADETLALGLDLAAAQRAVAALDLDLLHYPEIGMSDFAYFMAYARLAPVQSVGWGHPVTCGLDSIDYFLSFAGAEPEGAEAHYTERLVRCARPPVYYEPFLLPTEIPPRSAFGLPETGALYLCPQALFKFHPDFDAVLAAIAERDPTGWIVALAGRNATWPERLRARWARQAPILRDRVVFLPGLPLGRFMTLLAHADVMLDPPHFGSGNTLYESLLYGVPSVTWPGRFMRGRIVTGIYRLLGIADAPIAARLEDYAPLAVALARDPERRARLRAELIEKGAALYRDAAAVEEFASFVETAVAATAPVG